MNKLQACWFLKEEVERALALLAQKVSQKTGIPKRSIYSAIVAEATILYQNEKGEV